MIAETSRLAFYNLKKLGEKQRIVFEAVCELGSASNDLIAVQTKLPLQTVCGRVNELVKMGYLGLERRARNSFGNMANFWSVRNPNDKKLQEVAHENTSKAVYVGLDM